MDNLHKCSVSWALCLFFVILLLFLIQFILSMELFPGTIITAELELTQLYISYIFSISIHSWLVRLMYKYSR